MLSERTTRKRSHIRGLIASLIRESLSSFMMLHSAAIESEWRES